MYLDRWNRYSQQFGDFGVPANCPFGWEEIDKQSYPAGSTMNSRRTCISKSNSCSVLYLDKYNHYSQNFGDMGEPSHCPAGWDQADAQSVTSGDAHSSRRTCFKC